jgi:hypothetical protein
VNADDIHSMIITFKKVIKANGKYLYPMQAYDIYADLKHTNNILMELPCFRQMLDENYALSERADSLKIALEYLESKNRRLSKKVAKYKRMYKNAKKSKTTVAKNIGDVIDLVSDDDEEVGEEPVVVVKKEVVIEKPVVAAEKPVVAVEKPLVAVEKPVVAVEKPVVAVEKPVAVEKHVAVEPIVMTIEEDAEEEADDQEEEEVAAEEEEATEEEEEVAAEEEEATEEEEEEVAAEEEEATEEEEEEVAAEEEEATEEEEAAEEEEEEEEEAEEEESEVYEIVIKGKTYYIQNEKDGPIYEADENGEISLEVGVYKNGKPTFF